MDRAPRTITVARYERRRHSYRAQRSGRKSMPEEITSTRRTVLPDYLIYMHHATQELFRTRDFLDNPSQTSQNAG